MAKEKIKETMRPKSKEQDKEQGKEQNKARNNGHYILVKSPREYLIDSGLTEDEVEDLLVEEGYE